MSKMARLTKLISARCEDKDRGRLDVHHQRRLSALTFGPKEYATLLEGKALEAGLRPSSHPTVSVTPEMAMVIAHLLSKR